MTAIRHPRTLLALMGFTLGAAVGIARAETPLGVSSMAEAKANYQHDVSACRSHAVDEDVKTCMLEANRAYAEAKREVAHASGKSHTRVAKKETSKEATSGTSTSGTSSKTST